MSFEHLRVYQAAQTLDDEVRRLITTVPKGFSDDIKQLLRTLGSVLYNIAEANGSESMGRRRYHLEVALGAADEARAALRRLVAAGALRARGILKACSLSSVVAKMLIAMIAALPAD